MSEILKLRFLSIPEEGDTIGFVYGSTYGTTYSLDINYVGIGERVDVGEFEIGLSSSTLEDNVENFYEYFDYDYNQNQNTQFIIDPEYDFFELNITQVGNSMSFSNIYASSSFTYSIITEDTIFYQNRLIIELLNNPTNGDSISFDWYYDYPELVSNGEDKIETVSIYFISGTPSGNGEVPIGSDLDETYKNLEDYFSIYYNSLSDNFSATTINPGTTQSYFQIDANNLSIITNVVISSTSSFDAITSQQPPTGNNTDSEVLLQSPKFFFAPNSLDVERYRFTLQFYLDSNPSEGEIFSFYIKKNGSNINYVSKYFTANPAGNNIEVGIGGDNAETMENLLESLIEYNLPQHSPITYSANTEGNKIYIDCFTDADDVFTMNLFGNTADARIYGPIIDGDIDGFDSSTFEVRSWSGNVVSIPTDPLYTVTKQLLSADHTRLFIDFTKLVSDNYHSGITNYQSIQQITHLPPFTARWVQVKATNKLLGITRNSNSRIYYATNGWSTDGIHNLPRVLLGGTETRYTPSGMAYDYVRRYYHKDSVKRLFYKTEEHYGYLFADGNRDSEVFTNMSGDITLSDQYLRSFKIPTTDNNGNFLGDKVRMTFDYFTGKYTIIDIEYYDECKYPLIDVVFKNRYGVLETISMGKVSRKNLKTDRENFKRSVIDINGYVRKERHSNKDFNINGTNEWETNTGFIPDYMNDPIEDMFLSDEIWIIEPETNKAIPVVLGDSDFNRKRRITDGLINYTFRFEESHNRKYDLR